MGFSILTGLVAALLWAAGDILAKLYMSHWGDGRSWVLWNQVVGVVLYALFFYVTHTHLSLPAANWIMILILFGAIGLGGYLCFFSAIEMGNLSVISPIASAWAGVAFLLSAWFLPNSLSSRHWALVVLILVGVILISFPKRGKKLRLRSRKDRKAIYLAIGAMVCWGLFNFFLKFSGSAAGPYLPVVMVKVWGGVLFFYFYSQRKIKVPKIKSLIKRGKNLIVFSLPLAALLDIVAYAIYTMGATHGKLPIVAAFASLFSLFAALFGIFFLKERVLAAQKIGIALIVTSSFVLMMQ